MHSKVDVLADIAQLPPLVVRKLVDSLFADDARLLFGSVLLVLAALLAYVRTHSLWYLGWGAASIPVAYWRLSSGRAYRRWSGEFPVKRAVVFAVIGAWAVGALWGLASLVLVAETDPFPQFLLIVCQTAFVAGGAVRSSAVPLVARGQTLLAVVPLILACLASGKPFYEAFSVFAAFYLITIYTIIASVHQQVLQALLAAEERSGLVEELRQINKQLEELARTDALTRVENRRSFDIHLAQEWRRAVRNRTALSLLLLDVDFFKKFNDYYGHPTGDTCLHDIAQTIVSCSRRPGDIVARYGGEEFAVILTDTEPDGTLIVARQIIQAIEKKSIPHADHPLGVVTISAGCASARPEIGHESRDLVLLADKALYVAKKAGRNQAVCHHSKGQT